MKRKIVISLASIILGTGLTYAAPNPSKDHATGRQLSGQRKYMLFVNEGDSASVQEFNRGLESMRGGLKNRGFIDNLAGLYKSTAAGQMVSLSSSLIDLGVNALVDATRSKRPEWEKAVTKEATFVRRLPMQMEILDFYREPSTKGPLDPTDMNLNGFGCRQVIELFDENGNKTGEEEVFYLSCKVKTDDAGKMRILNHSKFEIEVDELRFNYAICDLPNDSLGMNVDSRIPFTFADRKDLTFIVGIDITSSWINEAMMVFNDEPLGSFKVTALIDENKLDDGIFRYSSSNPADKDKRVSVTGECFIVPRSYVGTSDLQTSGDAWGTGQYKVEMNILETCKIKADSYQDFATGKWKKDENGKEKWKGEWNKIKSRRKSTNLWNKMVDTVTGRYANSQWITILTEPTKNAFIQFETEGINRLMNSGGGASGAGAAQKAGPAAGK